MQNLVAMSSAEAELYGTVRASCELLGVRSLARDYGRWLDGRLYADASAALGIIHRQGLGKLRHLDTSTLWVQQAARAKLIEYIKVPGEDNPADILTKHLAAEPRERHAARCGLIYLEGRAAIAPRVCADDIGSFEISGLTRPQTRWRCGGRRARASASGRRNGSPGRTRVTSHDALLARC